MKCWMLNRVVDLSRVEKALTLQDIPVPATGEFDVLIRVSCCGICHTELDEIEGRTPPSVYPIVPGHQVVGIVERCGSKVTRIQKGDRVGVAWIFSACGECEQCLAGFENLCDRFVATGRDAHGGYAEYMVAREDFVYEIPSTFSDTEAAPLLCAGAIGYRSLKLTGLTNGQMLGLTGFGASGHLVLLMCKHQFPESNVFVFARSKEEQQFALELGATWSGSIDAAPPAGLHAIIDTTPAWRPVVESLKCLHPGGRLVINAIRKENQDKAALSEIDYSKHLWMEKEVKSVANITRNDISEFLELAARIPIRPAVETYSFDKANEALLDLKNKHVRGAKVLVMTPAGAGK